MEAKYADIFSNHKLVGLHSVNFDHMFMFWKWVDKIILLGVTDIAYIVNVRRIIIYITFYMHD